ncbi:Uncharacterised protein [uncultured Clostridium sp.]|nr:Uncharacterised protein [uncultured Clostridium sp.]
MDIIKDSFQNQSGGGDSSGDKSGRYAESAVGIVA